MRDECFNDVSYRSKPPCIIIISCEVKFCLDKWSVHCCGKCEMTGWVTWWYHAKISTVLSRCEVALWPPIPYEHSELVSLDLYKFWMALYAEQTAKICNDFIYNKQALNLWDNVCMPSNIKWQAEFSTIFAAVFEKKLCSQTNKFSTKKGKLQFSFQI